MKIVAKTLHGIEDLLVEELTALGAENIKKVTRAVEFEGDKKLLYRANYELRTALRVLVPFYQFRARHENHLYKKVREFDWSTLMNPNTTFAIDSAVSSNYFNHSKYVALKTKDAIVDQFRDATGRRPSVELQQPDLRLNVFIQHDNVSISLDSSGSSLHKRGYRLNTVSAPINEVLASAMILLSGWKNDKPLLDPMCGSGTIPIEAAMIAKNIPAQFLREHFSFHNWKDFDREIWEEVVNEANERINHDDCHIYPSDIDPESRHYGRKNAILAHVSNQLHFERKDFMTSTPPETPGIIIMNPPYDERMEIEDTKAFYKEIGDRLKNHYPGWSAWLISSNKDALKSIGLRPSKKYTLYNGKLECKYQKFEMFAGCLLYTSPSPRDATLSRMPSSA